MLGGQSEISEVDDIGDIVAEDSFYGSGQLKVFKGEIVAVISNDVYNSCRNCNAKIMESTQCVRSVVLK